MKHILFLMLLVFSMSSFAFESESDSEVIGQTETDCPQMREQNERSNPKAAIASQETKEKSSSASAQ